MPWRLSAIELAGEITKLRIIFLDFFSILVDNRNRMRPDGLFIFLNMLSKGKPSKSLDSGEKREAANNNEAWWQPAIMLFLRLSAWIAAPIIIAVFIGKWLDKKYNSAPWLFLACVGFAFFISMLGLIKNTMQEYKKIEKDFKNKDKKE